MKIYKITQPAQAVPNRGIIVKRTDNMQCDLMYNIVLDLTRSLKLPAIFRTHEIQLSTTTKELLEKLNKANIKYSEITK